MTAVLLALAAAEPPAKGPGPSVFISKSDGTKARGKLLSFEIGTYRVMTEAGKEVEIPATEIDLVRFAPRREKIPMPPGPATPGDEVPRRRRFLEELNRLDIEIRRLRREGRLGEFIEREEEALLESTGVREAMRHLVRLRHAAAVEHGRDSPAFAKRMRRHIDAIEDPKLREELRKRIRWLGVRRGIKPPRRRPPRPPR